MTIAKGDKLPEGTLLYMGADGPAEVSINDLTAGKKPSFLQSQGHSPRPVLLPMCHRLCAPRTRSWPKVWTALSACP